MTARTGQLLEGRILAQQIQAEISSDLKNLSVKKLPMPQLAAVQVGSHPSCEWYISQQEKLAGKLGIRFQRFSLDIALGPKKLNQTVHELSVNPDINGIFIAMPLAKGFDADEVLLELAPSKDVEGIHPTNLGLIVLRKSRLIPPTAYAAFKLIQSTGVELRGKKAVIVGQSAIVGRPLQLLLGAERVTTTVCNTGTSEKDLKSSIEDAEIVVGCAGQPGLIKGQWIREGAWVIDIGTTEINGKLVGDVEFETAKERAQFITPVPGGVGPLTVTMLMQNLMKAYEWQQISRK